MCHFHFIFKDTMKNIRLIISALMAGAIPVCIMCNQPKPQTTVCSSGEVAVCAAEVSKRLAEISEDISTRLSAFAAEVASDQLFSLRLLAENNRSADEVAGKAGQFIKPMGFSLLTIIDSASDILSSGDFPASAGNSALQKAALLSGEPKVIVDQVRGKNVVTLQAKKSISIVDGIPFYALGGVVIDDAFLARLTSRRGVTVLLKQGNAVMGMEDVKTISDVTGGKIVINNKEYGAGRIDLPFAGEGDAPGLIVIVEPVVAGISGK